MAVSLCQRCSTQFDEWPGACTKCGNTESVRVSSPGDALIGRTVKGRYEIRKRIGQGGMGAVYLAEQLGLGHLVALKFLNRELSQDPELVKRFLNEAKSYARVAHPNAVALHDFGQDEDGNLFISMEFVEGADLRRVLTERQRLPVHEALEVVLQVADVLAFAHQKGVIHRDLKPENLIIRQGLRGAHVTVLDFGIARLVEEGQARLTAQGTIAGTPRYMAPEQVEGKEIDLRVDIYALGLLLFEMLTGTHPFEGTSVAEILRKQVVQPMPRLAEALPGCDAPELEAVILRATAKNREERFPSMAELAQAAASAVPTQVARPSISLTDIDPAGVAATVVRAQPPSSLLLPPPIAADVTQPPGALDFQKTALPAPPSSRGAWGVIAVAVMVAGVGGAVFLGRTRAPAEVSPLTPIAVVAPQPARQELPEDVRTRLKFVAEEIRIKAEAEFIQGNFSNAKAMIAQLSDEQQQLPTLVKLKASVEEAAALLGRGKGQAARGDCEGAIKTFDALLKLYPNLSEAKRARANCQEMLPPSVAQ